MKEKLNQKGLATRREVLGDEYVDRSINGADDFNWPLQELVTDYCWDAIWNRPGLDRKTRSMINIAMLAALGRPHELRIHTVGAIRNGCSKEEIREILLQATVYCGFPAGIDAFKVAKEVVDSMEEAG
ncbi:4-carboxymuconolactone decarboxylase [Natronocella acetinitrilica]|uniref:4-carboxymuconolactone decarboxylase n=1 Tax=Natronocella acetinitrilica TaxID=414046 RepID=A0AAE3G3Z5_9GAMM|nr:carboxymuconolactone decarboxylase family protein [Natronocella acetinitrilica]MCP1673497.1 4-carboxymuconolactone decarboxylase [Natronocella acetinitrilica]